MKALNERRRAVPAKNVGIPVVPQKPRGNPPRPGLRFDKVVVRLLKDLRQICEDALPSGTTALVTVTAPIRQSGKTAAALEEKIRKHPARELKAVIEGNRVRLRLVKHKSRHVPKLIGFVHNPDTDPELLFDIAEEFLALPGGKSDLILTGGEKSCLIAYRAVCAQLGAFRKILMVSGNGEAEVLSPSKG